MLILGSAGSGKSMLSYIITLNWSDLELYLDQRSESPSQRDKDSIPKPEEVELLKKFNILLHIDLSKISSSCGLSKVIEDQITMRSNSDIEDLINYMDEYQEKCCVILDGWDEYDPSLCPEITAIGNGRRWPNAFVMITSRISRNLPEQTDYQYIVKGFSKPQAVRFINQMLQAYGRSDTERLESFIHKNKLWGIFMVPLLLNFLCVLHVSNQQLQEKVTNLFTKIVSFIIAKHKLKEEKLEPNSDVPLDMLETYRNELLALGKLAFSGLTGEKTKVSFDKKQIDEMVGESGLKLGLLQRFKPQNPTSPVTYQFPHKSIQDFVSGIYISNTSEGFDGFLEYTDSLSWVHDNQLLVMFICGLNPDRGDCLIEKIQRVSRDSTVTAAVCPEFSWRGWYKDNIDETDEAYMHTQKADEISTFVIKCCWEKENFETTKTKQSSEKQNIQHPQFPFSKPMNKTKHIQIEPKMDFKMLSLSNILKLIEMEQLSLNSNSFLTLCNLNVTKKNKEEVTKLFNNLACNKDTNGFHFERLKSDIKCQVFHGLIQHFRHLLHIRMSHVGIHKADMVHVMHDLMVHDPFVLYVDSVCLKSCEDLLVTAVSKFKRLRKLSLISLDMAGREARLPKCLDKLSQHQCLKYLKTDKTKLTEDQIKQAVISSLCDSLLFLSFYDLPLYVAVDELKKVVVRLVKLRWLDITNTGLASQQVVEIFSCLPPSTEVIKASNKKTTDAILSVLKSFPSLPSLRFVELNLSSVGEGVTQSLKEACEEYSISLIGNGEDLAQYGPELAKLHKEIRHEVTPGSPGSP